MGPTRLDEFDLIARHFAPLAAGYPGALGLRDDAALIDPPAGRQLVVTTDAIVAGVHFPADDPPGDVARRLLRVNLSDLAAMGAEPLAYTVAAVLPRGTDDSWIAAFASALAEDQARFAVHLAGGDTVATEGPLCFSLTAFGYVEPGRALTRAGARAGDLVAVSGTIGDGALGLKVALGGLRGLDEDARAALLDRFRLPRPRLAVGRRLRGLASAAMDVSDGLVADLGHICRASGVGAVVEAERVPLSGAARAALAGDPTLVDLVLGGGDDYELLFTLPEAAEEQLAGVSEATGVALTVIGRIVGGRGVRVVDSQGREIAPAVGGYAHFR